MSKKDDHESSTETFPRKMGSGSGSEDGYFVEARYDYQTPLVIGDQVFDNRWRRVDFKKSPIGIPNHGGYCPGKVITHLFSYEAAQALRWWIHAEVDRIPAFCFETRIVKCRITYSYESIAVSAGDVAGMRARLVPTVGEGALPPEADEKIAAA